jgi:hypothetical protein
MTFEILLLRDLRDFKNPDDEKGGSSRHSSLKALSTHKYDGFKKM